MASPNESSMTLACHPPYLNPPDVSSSGPPGACMTPSIVAKVVVMIFRISDSLVNRGVGALRLDVPRRVFRIHYGVSVWPGVQLIVDRRRSKSTEPDK